MPLMSLLRALLLLTALPGLAPAQSVPDSEGFRVSLVTVGPGSVYWERFGHNALLVEDVRSGDAVTYNYGMFDFRQDSFMLNFLRGRMLYQMTAFDGARDIAHYIQSGRRVRMQELELTPDQTVDLLAFLEWNREPGNRDYRYDYFLDNCSTRIRDALDRVLDGRLAERYTALPAEVTLRHHVRRLTRPQGWLYLGTQLGLGPAVDRPISNWEEFFLPMELASALDDAVLPDGRPLVRASRVLAEGSVAEPSSPPTAWPVLLLVGLVLAGLVFRWPGLANGWWALSGLVGLGLVALWLLTEHSAAHANVNLLLFSPLALLLIGCRVTGSAGAERTVAWLMLACLLAALLIPLSPWLIPGNYGVIQDTTDLLALAFPVSAIGLFQIVRKPTVTSGSQP